MVVHYLHEPKTLRPISSLQTSELRQEGALLTWINQITSYPTTDLVRLKDGKLISMSQLICPSTCHLFRDLQEHPIPLLQVSLLQVDGKHQLEKIIPYIAFQIIQDFVQRIYLLSFLLVLQAHLHLNQDLLRYRPITE